MKICPKCGKQCVDNAVQCPKCKTQLSQTPIIQNQPMAQPAIAVAPQKHKIKWWGILLIIFGAFILIGILANLGGSPEKQNDSGINVNAPVNEQSKPADASIESPSSEPPKTVAVDMELSSGHYTAGIDFPAGKYNVTAISGTGNVSTSNMFSGGMNAMMGESGTDEMYEQEFKNAEFKNGTTLSISGVEIELTPSK